METMDIKATSIYINWGDLDKQLSIQFYTSCMEICSKSLSADICRKFRNYKTLALVIDCLL